MIVAMVGHRSIDAAAAESIQELAAVIAAKGHWVRSGHAKGADYAAERGARKRCLIWLPWRAYNSDLPILGRFRVLTNSHHNAYEEAKAHHPNWGSLTRGGKAMHARNYLIVMGQGNPADFLVGYARVDDNGEWMGGSGQAYRIAKAHGIPTFNLCDPDPGDYQRFCELILSPEAKKARR